MRELVHDLLAPDVTDLTAVVGTIAAEALSRMPGGWRTASQHELAALGLTRKTTDAIQAMQRLVRQGYPCLPVCQLLRPEDVARVYEKRLGGLEREVVVAVALDRGSRLIAEIDVSTGGIHSASMTPADVFRPLIRCGASAFILLHNHPSGDPTPSRDDLATTSVLANIAEVVGITLVDHVVVAARGGGWSSILERKEAHEEHRTADAALLI